MPNSNRMSWPFPTENSAPWYDAFETMVTAIDASGYAAREDRNLLISGGGTLDWDLPTQSITWDAPIRIISTITGHIFTVAADSLSVDDGEAIYVNIVRSPTASSTRTVQIGTQVPSSDNAFMLAIRVGDSLYWRNGQRMDDGHFLYGLGAWFSGAGTGDVLGPAGATDMAVALFDTASGKLLQDSPVTVDPGTGNIATPGTVDGRDVALDGAKLDGISPGAQPNAGAANGPGSWKFDGSTANSDPGAGKFRLNTGDPTTATALYVNIVSTHGDDILASLMQAKVGMQIHLVRESDPAIRTRVHVSGAPTDNSGWVTIPLDGAEASNSTTWSLPSPDDVLAISFVAPANDTRGVGPYLFDTATTAADPTEGYFRLDNASFTSADNLFIDVSNVYGLDNAPFYGAVQAGSPIYVSWDKDLSKCARLVASGPAVDNTGWYTIPLTAASARISTNWSNPPADTPISLSFVPVSATAVSVAAAGALMRSGGNLTGNVTADSGITVDGRDVSVDGAKLDGITAGAQKNSSIEMGEWLFGGDTLGFTSPGEFETDNATVASVTSIRFNANSQVGAYILGAAQRFPQSGILLLQDATTPATVQVWFEYSTLTYSAGIYPQFDGTVVATQGANWSGNNYSVQLLPAENLNYLLKDASREADGIQLLERAAVPNAAVAGRAHLWAKNTTPNELIYSSDVTGDDQNVSWAVNNLVRLAGGFAVGAAVSTSATPFTYATVAGDFSIGYDRLAKRWYCTYIDTASGTRAVGYDSADGLSWSTQKAIDPGTTLGDMSQYASDGTYVAVGVDGTFYRSTDLTMANMVAFGSFTSITGGCTGLVYDDTHSLWLACGDNGTNGYIESSPDGTTWTVRETMTGILPKSMAHNYAQGYTAVTCGASSTNIYYSTSGTTFSIYNTTVPTTGLVQIYWCQGVGQFGAFMGIEANTNVWHADYRPYVSWHDTAIDAYSVYNTPELTVVGDGSGNETLYRIYDVAQGLDNAATMVHHGYLRQNMRPIVKSFDAGHARIEGGNGRIVWPRFGNGRLMVANYGPQVD